MVSFVHHDVRGAGLEDLHQSASVLCVTLVSGVIKMALRELSSLERFLGLKKPNKYSTQGGKKVNQAMNVMYLELRACIIFKYAFVLGNITYIRDRLNE